MTPDPNQTLHQVKFEIDFYSKKGPKTEFSADEMETQLQGQFLCSTFKMVLSSLTVDFFVSLYSIRSVPIKLSEVKSEF